LTKSTVVLANDEAPKATAMETPSITDWYPVSPNITIGVEWAVVACCMAFMPAEMVEEEVVGTVLISN
jgi:hypothetical protein